MAPIRVAIIDDDSGLLTVLNRRFAAMHWEGQVLSYAAEPAQLAALRLHALVINPALTGLDYPAHVGSALPGLAVLICSDPAPVATRVRLLRMGADDFVSKPCHPEELVARIEAVLRRRRTGELPAAEALMQTGELAIRPDRFDAYVGDRCASLSRKEFELLRQLAGADGRVLEREEIYQRVWGYTMAHGDRSVDVFVRKLRQKLARISPRWRYLHTHFGVGYRFAAEPLEPQRAPEPVATAPPPAQPVAAAPPPAQPVATAPPPAQPVATAPPPPEPVAAAPPPAQPVATAPPPAQPVAAAPPPPEPERDLISLP